MTSGFLLKGIVDTDTVTWRNTCEGNSWLAGVVCGRASDCVGSTLPSLALASYCSSFRDRTLEYKLKNLIKKLAIEFFATSQLKLVAFKGRRH